MANGAYASQVAFILAQGPLIRFDRILIAALLEGYFTSKCLEFIGVLVFNQ
jgi:hypothetical protein